MRAKTALITPPDAPVSGLFLTDPKHPAELRPTRPARDTDPVQQGIVFADERASLSRARALVLYPDFKRPGARRTAEESLAEAVNLTQAIDLEIVDAMVIPLNAPKPGTLLGTGKLDELAAQIAAFDIEVVIVDGPVSPVQQRNLERALKAKVLDRTGLILEIFGERAATKEGTLQVDLAHLSYQKSRLVRSWTHLERQRGGGGFMGGPGETQKEADRRALTERIGRIERELERVTKTRTLHRAGRKKVPYPIVALVGYTNAGKSSLFNAITESGVLAKDMLFATLDPTLRGLSLPGGRRIILSDTVGFIADLPTELVAAFRATLEEVLEADLILHVRDIASSQSDAERADVLDVLEGLGVERAKLDAMIEVPNKIDLLDGETRETLVNQSSRRDDFKAVSAASGQGVADLVARIEAALGADDVEAHFLVPPSAGAALAALHQDGDVRQTTTLEDGSLHLVVRLTPAALGRINKKFPGLAQDPAQGASHET